MNKSERIVGEMSLYSASRGVSMDKIRSRYLGRNMDHQADSIAKLSQGRENWYIGRGFQWVKVLWKNVNLSSFNLSNVFSALKGTHFYILSVIVFECMDLSIGKRVDVSGLSCVSNKVLRFWDNYKVICDLIHHQKYTVYVALV